MLSALIPIAARSFDSHGIKELIFKPKIICICRLTITKRLAVLLLSTSGQSMTDHIHPNARPPPFFWTSTRNACLNMFSISCTICECALWLVFGNNGCELTRKNNFRFILFHFFFIFRFVVVGSWHTSHTELNMEQKFWYPWPVGVGVSHMWNLFNG